MLQLDSAQEQNLQSFLDAYSNGTQGLSGHNYSFECGGKTFVSPFDRLFASDASNFLSMNAIATYLVEEAHFQTIDDELLTQVVRHRDFDKG